MKNTKLLLLALLPALMFLQSCGNDDDDGGNGCSGSNFGFLTAGNEWESSYFGFFFSDTLLRAEVLEETEPGVFKLRTHTAPDEDLDATYYLQDCGDYLLRSAQLPIKLEDRYMKANRVVGDAWTYTDRHTSVASEYEVVAVNVTVTVPAGTFTCDKITYHQVGTVNVDTIYLNNDFFFIKYNGLSEYELLSKNF